MLHKEKNDEVAKNSYPSISVIISNPQFIAQPILVTPRQVGQLPQLVYGLLSQVLLAGIPLR